MAVTHATAARNALADQIDTLVNTGAGTAKVRIRASTTTLVDFDLANPAFGAASGGTITLNGVPIAGTAAGAGNADNFQVLDRDAAVIFSGTVTATGGGGDMTINNVSIAVSQACSLTSLTYTAPA